MAKSILAEAIAALERLEITDGRLAKESILEGQRNNKALRVILRMSLGTDRYFVHPAMNLVSTSCLSPAEAWRGFVTLTKKLKIRKLTGNEAKNEVNRFLASCPPVLMKWFCRVLNHDLRIGVDRNTVQKIWGQDFLLSKANKTDGWSFRGCGLAKTYSDKMSIEFPVAVESKLDGERALILCFPTEHKIVVLTRSGRRRLPIEQVDKFVTQVVSFTNALNGSDFNGRPLYLDGEFQAKNWNQTSSIVRKTRNFDADKFLSDVKLVLWDWAPLHNYQDGKFDTVWTHRKAELLLAAGATQPTAKMTRFSNNVFAMGHTLVYAHDQLMFEYERRLDAGHEGVVLKKIYAPHTFKRSTDMLKLKPEEDVSGRIVDFYAGEKQNAVAPKRLTSKIKSMMTKLGAVKVTKQHLYCKTKNSTVALQKLKDKVGNAEQRLSKVNDEIVAFRHGVRLGGFVVELDDGSRVRVGGGYKTKQGNDERSKFWRNRHKMIGMYMDLRVQATDTAEATGRFNRFIRLREDL